MNRESKKRRIGIATIALIAVAAMLVSMLPACQALPKANVQVKVFKE